MNFFMTKAGLLSVVPPGFLSVQKIRDIKELQYIPMSSAITENLERGPQGLVARNFSMEHDIDYAMWDRSSSLVSGNDEYRITISPRGNSRLDRKDILIYGFGILETTNNTKPRSLTVSIEHDHGEDFYHPISSQTESWIYSWDNLDYFKELEPMIHLKKHTRVANFRFRSQYVENMYIKLYGITAESLGQGMAG